MSQFSHQHRGPVFAAVSSGASAPPTPATSKTALSSDDSMSKYEAMFNENMAKQMETYGKTNELNVKKNTMQSIMDVGMKASKAVQT